MKKFLLTLIVTLHVGLCFGQAVRSVPTIDNMVTNVPPTILNGQPLLVLEPNKGGLFKPIDATATNLGTVFPSAINATKVWQRIYNSEINARWFAEADGTTDDTAALQQAIDLSLSEGRPLLLSSGTYRVVPASGLTGYKDTASTIHERMVPSGMVLADFTYEAAGAAGTVNYRGTNYTIGQQIIGNFYHRGYARNTEVETVTINAAGSGYSATEVLTLDLSGGSGTAATITIDTVGGSGEVTGATLTTAGTYTTPSTTETGVATTGGSGAGATFDITQQLHSSNDAALIPVLDVALWLTNNNFRLVGAGRGLSAIYVDGPGVGLGILGTTPGTSPGDPTKIHIENVDFIGNGTDAQVGMFASHCTFHGQFSIYAENIRIGTIFNQCWNMHIQNASANGLAKMDDFIQLWNANQTTVDHMFTLNFKKGAIVDTASAHGQSTGTLAYFNDDSTRMLSGLITEVVDSDTLVFQEVDDVANTIGVNEIIFDPLGAPVTNSMTWGKLHGGRGLVASNPDGLWVDGTWQNDTEIAVQLYADRNQGSFGPTTITGHVEGPAQMLHTSRAPFDPNSVMRAVHARLRGFVGRPASGSFFGERHGIVFENTRNSVIENGYITVKQENISTNKGIWVKNSSSHIDIRNMEFDATVSTNRIQNDQEGVVQRSSQFVMFDINAPVLDSRTGISANTSQVTATVSRAGKLLAENTNDSFSYYPQYVLLRVQMVPTTVGSSGRIMCRLTNAELHDDSESEVVNVNFNSAEADERYEVIVPWPVNNSGQVRFQWYVTPGAGWVVDCEVKQLGSIY